MSYEVASESKAEGAIRFLVNARGLQLQRSRVLHETLFVPVLWCDSERMIWKGKERSRIRAVQMDNIKGLMGIGRIDKVLMHRFKNSME